MKPEPPKPDRRFSKDVAKQLDRRQMRRKLFLWGALIGAIALAVMYLTCGKGWGLGGKGKGEGEGAGTGVKPLVSTVDAGPRRCTIRVAAKGITVDGKPATRDECVAACKTSTGADVIVTGGAREAEWAALKSALEQAGVTIYLQEPKGSGSADK